MPDRVGQNLGNYRLIRLLGRGGFAEVYLGEHRRLGTLAALKILSARLTEADEQAFLSEARTLAQLEHPHIVRIFDFDVHEGTPFLVMSYASQGTLRERHPRGTRLPVSTVMDYLSQIAPALQYAHDARIIHRDIKPENMLQGRHRELLLSDFGIALLSQSSHLQSTQTIVGTVSYMAPEQLQGKPRIASDQYSLAIVVYEWLCGERPFQGGYLELYSQHLSVPPPALQEKLPGCSPALNQVLQTALAKDPTQRFASITAFVTAFEQASLPASPSRPLPTVRPSQTPPAPSLPPPASPLLMPSESASSVPPPSLQERDTLLPRHPQQPPENQEFTHIDGSYPPVSESFSTPANALPTAHLEGPHPLPAPRSDITVINHRRLPISRATLLIGLALLVIVSSVGLFFFIKTNQIAADNAQATAQANNTAIAYAATIPAVAGAAQANATTTTIAKNSLPYPLGNGKLVLYDPLRDNSQGHNWKDGSFDYKTTGGSGYCKFSGGAYDASEIDQSHFNICIAQNTDFGNFAYEVQMKIIRGDSGGILFRGSGGILVTDYQFEIDQNGYYILYAWVQTDPVTEVAQTLTSGFSSAINAGLNQSNLIAVVANGSKLALYVNKRFVTSISDNHYSHGQIGVITGAGGEVIYSNAKVWTL